MDYRDRIRSLRKERHLSQSAVAQIIHIDQRTYSDYENGKARLQLTNMIILAKFYDVSMDYICGASNQRNPFPNE